MGIAELIANAWNSAAVDQYALKAKKGLKSSDLQSSLFDTEGQASLPGMGKKPSDWDEQAHPRAAKGSTGVHGGQFVKKDEATAVGGKESADELRAEKRKHDEANYRKHLSLLQDEALDRTAEMLRNSQQSEESQMKLAAVSEELSKRSGAPKRPKGIRDPLEGLNAEPEKPADTKELLDEMLSSGQSMVKFAAAKNLSQEQRKALFEAYAAHNEAKRAPKPPSEARAAAMAKATAREEAEQKPDYDKRLAEQQARRDPDGISEQPADKGPIPIRDRKMFAESLAKQGKSQSEIAEAMVKRGVALSDANRLASKATGDQGPKDGDVNAEGLVFKNGRWHREGDEETSEQKIAKAEAALRPKLKDLSEAELRELNKNGSVISKAHGPLGDPTALALEELMSRLDKPESTEPPKEPEAPKSPADQTPSEEATSERDRAIESGKTPRQAADRAQKKLDQDYEFARASEVANAGEDLKGSARHRVNAWKGLAEAEKDGTAAAMVTRDQLLKLEPHDLFIHADKNPLTALAMHYALKAFPAKPGTGKRGDHEKDRKQYLEAYQDIKKKAEELAKTKDSTDVVPAIKELQTHVGDLIQKLRGQKSKDSMGMATATDKYNQTANDLVNLHRALATDWRSRKTGVAGKTVEFGNAVKERYGDMSVENIADHAKDIMEGKSLNTTFDREKKSVDRFDPADLYVKIATRTGGRDLSSVTSDANKATKHMVDTMGLRGVQWGNSVTDDERKHHAAKSVEALTDLADVLGLHPKDIALDGKLGLAIGARGRGGAVAHYEPTQKVINLTRKNGVGSLAHEWAHGFDHTVNGDDGRYLSEDTDTHETQQKGSATWRGRTSNPERMEKMGYTVTERPLSEVRQTMSGVHDAQRDYRKRLLEFISNSGLSAKKAAYWASEKEIFARTFERYVQHKLEQSGKKNTYLAGIETKAHKAGGFWPTDDEVKAMAPAFDKFFDAYRKHKHGSAEKVKFSRREAVEAFAPTRFRPVLLAN